MTLPLCGAARATRRSASRGLAALSQPKAHEETRLRCPVASCAAPRYALRAALLLALLALLCGRSRAAAQPKHWSAEQAERESARRNVTLTAYRALGGGARSVLLRCNAPAAAVDTCLKSLPNERAVEHCLELAYYAMSPAHLTRVGFATDSPDTLQCTYLALLGDAHELPSAPSTAFLLSLGLMLGAPRSDGGAWLQALLSYHEAPVDQARLHSLEAELRAILRDVAAAAADDDADALLRGAEALELFGALRSWSVAPDRAPELHDIAEAMQDRQEELRGIRRRRLRSLARELATSLAGGGRATVDARARKQLAAADLPSQASCVVLAAQMESCSLAMDRLPEDHEASGAAAHACMLETTRRLKRALLLKPVDACAREVVASLDDVPTLFEFMLQLSSAGLKEVVEKLVLPPPRGEAPHAKSPDAVEEAFNNFDVIVLEPFAPKDVGDIEWTKMALEEVERRKQRRKQQAGAGAKGAAAAQRGGRAATTTTAAAAAPPEDAAVARGCAKLLALLLLCAAAWRAAAAIERRRTQRGRPHAA